MTLPEAAAAARVLAELESRLDPAHPQRSGVRVLAYGEISATLLLPAAGFDSVVAKRMAGFPDESAAADYRALVDRYLAALAELGVNVVPTVPVVVPRSEGGPVVYLLQPRVDAATLGDTLVHGVGDAELHTMITTVLRQVDAALSRTVDGREVAVDAQLSNWSFPAAGVDHDPALIDVGTPFLRDSGGHALDVRVLLAAVPPGIRSWYLWRGTGDSYMDDYFVPRLAAVDMLGNLLKEQAGHRLAVGLAAANQWLGNHPDLRGEAPITAAEVKAYYDADAATLESFLRVRRMDRFVRGRLLRRGYDFILPGRVQR